MGKKCFYCVLLWVLFFCLVPSVTIGQEINGSFTSKFKRYHKNEAFSGTQNQDWNAVAWKGDRLHAQIVVWSDVDINGLSYNISDLSSGGNVIDSSNIQLRFGKYIKGDPDARSCGEYPNHTTSIELVDALDDQIITNLNPSDPIKLWLSVDIPETTKADSYTGTLTINGGSSPLVFNILLEVVNFTLPEVSDWGFHLDLWQFPSNILDKYNTANPGNPITIWSDEHFALLEPAYRLLADTGQKAISAHIKEGGLGAPSMVRWIKKNDGTWEYDFTAFEKYVTTLLSWGIVEQIDCFSPVGWNQEVIPHWDEASSAMVNLSAPLGSPIYNTRWNHFLTAFKTFLESKGWFEITVLYLDEVEQDKLDDVFAMVNSNHADWKIGIAHTKVLSAANSDKLYDASGILGTASSTGRDGKISTFYTSCTQKRPNSYVTPENSLAEMTWMGWHASKENLNGYLRWAYDNWQLADPLDARDGAHTAGDFALVYRASNNSPSEYLPSLRLLLLREGIQDFEKIKALKAHLEASTDPQDQDKLNAFMTIIDQFGPNSGVGAASLVREGQQAIAEITKGIFSYCRVNGGSNSDYYVSGLTSSGGDTNIDFNTSTYPIDGYEHHSSTKVGAVPGSTFTLSLTNSTASNCARTSLWIDWNNDANFDNDEKIFTGGNASSCDNMNTYDLDVTVPQHIEQGIKRMRIQVRDADDDEPLACGIINRTGTADFDIEVLDVYCSPQGGTNKDYFIVDLRTTGGRDSNINFNSNGFPKNGYLHHTLSNVIIEQGDTFFLHLENSQGANCARTKVWIDWNGDHDFGDLGELIYNDDIFQSCENAINKSIEVEVPVDAVVDTTRMRIGMRDAWLAEPEACMIGDFSSTFDFDVELKKKPFNLGEDNFTIKTIGETCQNKDNGKLEIRSGAAFNFRTTINGDEYVFTEFLQVDALKPGTYQFCLTLPSEPNFEQCYEALISEAPEISVKTTLHQSHGKTVARLQIESGTPPFTIKKNNQVVGISLSDYFELNVQHGDVLWVATDKQCEGNLQHSVFMPNQIVASPNPTQDSVQIYVPDFQVGHIWVGVTNFNGQQVLSRQVEVNSGVAKVSLGHLPSGVYFMGIDDGIVKTFKLVKQ
ncbi:glycoside hydrolase domain-containing protein [Flagellimonas myxillae]|uniref:glycoside hydrolase domain-containing protein n=1 Tax=Flagellimonas myxillae TaxID=2942214 RepID=UPI00201F3C01|nr:glycoside hydrolase domain-containing protein [Muricauda myxillae]MCL6266919.1 GEVED domain-containing protein [Muricauda myxillae]